jgi:hypothetical protein
VDQGTDEPLIERIREPSTKLDTAEVGEAVAVGGVVITRQRIVVVSDGEVVAAFSARELRSISVVDGFASKQPVREAVWGVGFIVFGVARIAMTTRWWERAIFAVMAVIGVWVSARLLQRTTQVRLRLEAGGTTTLLAGMRLPRAEVERIRQRLTELGHRVR